MEDLRYPIGQFHYEGEITTELIEQWIHDIEEAPSQLREAVKGLTDDELDQPYRPGGWTIRQVVHHIVDSHMNGYIRFKLAFTEEHPTIKPYMEEKWAELSDYHMPIEVSLSLLQSLHERWVVFLRSLKSADLTRTFHHPDSGSVPLAKNIGIYSWHGRHHIAHITSLRQGN